MKKLVTFQEGIFNLKKFPRRRLRDRLKKMKELERLENTPVTLDINTKKKEAVKEDWQKTNRNDKTDGMSQKARRLQGRTLFKSDRCY